MSASTHSSSIFAADDDAQREVLKAISAIAGNANRHARQITSAELSAIKHMWQFLLEQYVLPRKHNTSDLAELVNDQELASGIAISMLMPTKGRYGGIAKNVAISVSRYGGEPVDPTRFNGEPIDLSRFNEVSQRRGNSLHHDISIDAKPGELTPDSPTAAEGVSHLADFGRF